jgi:hypothetical protein
VNTAGNNGVSGAISLTTVEGSVVLFNIDAIAWQDKNAAAPLDVTGRGDTGKAYDSLDEAGSGFVSGQPRTDGYPAPANLKDQTGTLTLTYHYLKGASKSFPIKFTSFDDGRNKGNDATPTVTVGWLRTGATTWTGFDGTQPAAASAPTGNKQLWDGTVWSKDPQGLQTSGTVRWRARAITDTNAAEWTALGTFIAAQVAPVAGLKLRGVMFNRTDSNGGFYVAQWGLTDTAEDFINANTRTTVDPSGLTSTATAAAINGTPSTPSGDSYVTVSTTTYELNDDNIATVVTYDLRTSKQAVEEDGSRTDADAGDLEDGGLVTQVTTSSTPPSTPSAPGASVLRLVSTVQLNPGHWKHTFAYGPRTSTQEVEFPGTVSRIDAQALNDGGSALVVNGSSTAPATPAAPGTSKLVHTESSQITNGGKWKHFFQFGPRDSKDDIEMPGTRADADAGDLEDGGIATVVTGSSTVPATPSAPGTSVLTLVSSTQQTDGKWAHRFTFGPVNTQQAKEYAGTTSIIDPSALRDGGTALVVNASSTAPATPTAPGGSKLIATESTRLTAGGKWQHVFRFGPQTSADEITMRAEVTDDPSGVAKKGNVITIQSTATPATAPSTPIAGTVYRTVTTRQLKDGKYEQDYQFGMSTPANDISNPENRGQSDPNGLETVAYNAALNTPPAYGTGEPYLLHNRLIDDAGNILYIAESRARSSIHEITFRNSSVRTDQYKIDGEERITEVVNTGGSATGAATQVELRKTGTIRQKLTTAKDQVTDVYEVLDSRQKRTFPHLKTLVDASAIQDWQTIPQIVDTTAVAATVAGAAPSGLVYSHRETQEVTPANGTAAGQSLIIDYYGKATTANKVTLPHTATTTDTNALESTQTIPVLWTISGAEPSAPSTPSGFVLVDKRYVTIPDDATHQVIVYHYALNDTKTGIERPQTVATRDGERNFDRVTTSVIATSAAATTVTIADAEWTAAMAATATAATIASIQIRKLTDLLYERKTVTLATGAILTIEDTLGTWRSAGARLAGGFVEVYVPTVISKGGTQQYCLVEPTRVFRVTATIRIRRRMMTDAAGVPVTSPVAAIGTVNNATAFTFPTGSLTFVGRRIPPDNIGIAAVHPVWVEDVLLYQSDGHYDEGGIAMGPRWGAFGATEGWNVASTFGAAWTAGGYSAVDYSGFFT